MKISHLIFLGFLFILIMFTIATYINYKQAEKVNENSEWFAKSTTVMRESNRFQRNILNMVSGLRGYLLTGEAYFMQSYDSAAQENVKILEQLNEIIPDTSAQAVSLQELIRLNDEWMNNFANPLVEARTVAHTSDSSLRAYNALYRDKLVIGTEKNINNRLRRRFREFTDYEYQLREARSQILSESIVQTRTISFWLTTASILTRSRLYRTGTANALPISSWPRAGFYSSAASWLHSSICPRHGRSTDSG